MLDRKHPPDKLKLLKEIQNNALTVCLLLFLLMRLKCFFLQIPHMFIYYDLSVHVFVMITW